MQDQKVKAFRHNLLSEEMVRLSVIIPSKGRPFGITSLIANIRNQDYPQGALEIIVIDDGSVMPYEFDDLDVRVVRHNSSLGAQRSRNEGIKAARGEYIFMLDDDIEIIGLDYISRAVAILDQQDDVAAVFGRKYDVHESRKGREILEFSLARATFYSGDLVAENGITSAGPIEWGNQVYITRRELLVSLGGYDGVYGRNGGHSFREESDLHARLRQEGYKLWYEPKIAIRHHVVSTGGHGANVSKRLYWIAHNHIIFMSRHLRFWPLRAIGFIFDIVRYSWVQGHFRHMPSMIKGYIDGWKHILRSNSHGQNSLLKDTNENRDLCTDSITQPRRSRNTHS